MLCTILWTVVYLKRSTQHLSIGTKTSLQRILETNDSCLMDDEFRHNDKLHNAGIVLSKIQYKDQFLLRIHWQTYTCISVEQRILCDFIFALSMLEERILTPPFNELHEANIKSMIYSSHEYSISNYFDIFPICIPQSMMHLSMHGGIFTVKFKEIKMFLRPTHRSAYGTFFLFPMQI